MKSLSAIPREVFLFKMPKEELEFEVEDINGIPVGWNKKNFEEHCRLYPYRQLRRNKDKIKGAISNPKMKNEKKKESTTEWGGDPFWGWGKELRWVVLVVYQPKKAKVKKLGRVKTAHLTDKFRGSII